MKKKNKVKEFKSKDKRISQERAQKYGPELVRLREKANGGLKTKAVVDAARSEESTLHDFFQWDDTKAGELYRRVQARHLINGIHEIVIDENGEEKDIPLFYNVIIESSNENEEDSNHHRYVFNEEIAEDSNYKEQQLQKAIQEIKIWESKYSMIKELSDIFGAIKKIQKKLEFKK